jgi:hypothetical protein
MQQQQQQQQQQQSFHPQFQQQGGGGGGRPMMMNNMNPNQMMPMQNVNPLQQQNQQFQQQQQFPRFPVQQQQQQHHQQQFNQSFQQPQQQQLQQIIQNFIQQYSDKTSLIYHDLLTNEMINVLLQLYQGMPVNEIMTLDEISLENPSLFNQIKSQAEVNTQTLLSNKIKALQNPSLLMGGGGVNNVNSLLNKFSTSRFEPMDNTLSMQDVVAASSHPHHHPSQQQHHRAGGSNKRPYEDRSNNQFPSSKRLQSGGGGGYQSQNSPAGGGGGQNRGFFQENAAPPMNFNHQNHASEPLNQLFQSFKSSQQFSGHQQQQQQSRGGYQQPHSQNVVPSEGGGMSKPSGQQQQQQLPAGNYVNGYINESSVVIDVERVKAMTNKLQQASSAATVGFPIAHNFPVVTNKLCSRLQSYLKDIKIPPALPPILFGLLPMEPLYPKGGFSSSSTGGSGGDQQKMNTKKLAMPEFK